ncbi:unnamed protein product [Prorocentrum cordatum]|uniref:Uncharacterized protein n=1 Tax=Prorocentrum cordatum TaxID=2364126 RepID=A0ABN9TPB4_9DINO|nr:unnamed protein product [Polarella glacialis]
MAPCGFGPVLDALKAADLETEESVAHAGSWLVWRIRRQTRHPRLSEAFPDGFFMVTECDLALTGLGVPEEVDSCRAALPPLSGVLGEPAALEAGGAGGNAPLSPSFRHGILEERLQPLGVAEARRLLSEVSRRRLRLAAPLLVAVQGEAANDPAGPGRLITYMGVQTGEAEGKENGAPEPWGPNVRQAIRVSRPRLASDATIGDALLRSRSCAKGGEVRLRARYDLSIAPERGSSGGLCGAWAGCLPAELLPGPFISLAISWGMPRERAEAAPLLQGPAALSSSAVVHMRCSDRGDRGRRRVVHAGPRRRHNLREGSLAGGGGGTRVAPRATPVRAASAPPAGSAREERPGRDFVDRLWLDAAARCASAQCLVELVQAVLAWLGRPGSVAPFVRRENGTEVAELVRTAVKISTLRRYAASPGGAQLQDLAASWEERRRQLSTVEAVAPLVLGMGVECLRRDFVHVITRRGYIMPQDLDHFTDASRPVEVQVDRLHCLHRMAELALMCTRRM